MYLLGKEVGGDAQDELWAWVEAGIIKLYLHPPTEHAQMRRMMRQYHDRPMDLGDASLMAAAEALSVSRVFSIDQDFFIYRTSDGVALEVIPGPMPSQNPRRR